MSTKQHRSGTGLEIRTAVGAGRWPVTAVFFLNGLLLATYIVRLPTLKQTHDLTDGQMGEVGMLFAVAALAAMQLVGRLAARFGTASIIRLVLLVMPCALIAAGIADSTLQFIAALVLMGALNGLLDVAMNGQAVAVERTLGRPILSGCHAAWSVSAVTAAIAGAALLRGGTATPAVFCIVGGIVVIAGLGVGLVLEPGKRPEPRRPAAGSTVSDTPSGPPALGWRRGWTRAIVRLGLIGFVLMICEGAALGWSGIFLRDSRGTTLQFASTAVVAFTACQTVGRLFGDRLRSIHGDATVFRAGVLIATAGLTLAVLEPVPTVSIAGFAILGLGGSVLLPVTYGAVGRAAPTGYQAAAMSRFTTFTYAGILLGPALIGWIAEVINLQWTLALLIPLLGILAFAHPFAEPSAKRARARCVGAADPMCETS